MTRLILTPDEDGRVFVGVASEEIQTLNSDIPGRRSAIKHLKEGVVISERECENKRTKNGQVNINPQLHCIAIIKSDTYLENP